jgi:type II secretory pathway component GspD/PulD (secretin)
MLTTLLTLSLWGAATLAAPQDGASPQAPSLPKGVKPGDYVQAVVRLYNKNKAEEAGPYIKAANDFRSQLTPSEVATLDHYQGLIASQTAAPVYAATEAPRVGNQAGADARGGAPTRAPRDRAVELVSMARRAMSAGQVDEARQLAQEAHTMGVPFAAEEDNPARVLADIDNATTGPMARAVNSGSKQQALWMLKSARQQMSMGNYDQATQLLSQVKAMSVKWTLFDDTPAKVESDMAKLRPNTVVARATGDRRQARARLKEARDMLQSGDYQRAEQIAIEVNSWGLSYGLLEDNPNKVVSAARALRKREDHSRGAAGVRNEEAYASLVRQAREHMAAGDFAGAEQHAQKALALGVVPSVTADRAESVLSELSFMRAPKAGGAVPHDPAIATASNAREVARAEQQANEYLSQNNQEAARAKFEEAARLQQVQVAGDDQEVAPVALIGPSTAAPVGLEPVDPFAQVPGGDEPQDAPVPIAPAGATGQVDNLEQAQALLAVGNFAAARQWAEKAKQAGGGLEADNMLAQVEQARQQATLSLYEAAIDGIRKGEIERSRALLHELADQDLDEGTQQKVQDLLLKLPSGGQVDDRLRSVQDVEAVKTQQLNAEIGTKVAEARHLLDVDPAKAIGILEQAKAQVQAAGLSEAVTRTMTRRIDVNIDLAKRDKAAFDEKMKDKAYRDQIERQRLREILAGEAKKERVKQLMEKAIEAEANGDHVTAEKLSHQAAEIDPNEIAATALETKARWARHYERDLKIKRDMEEGAVEAFQLASEAGIADPDVQRNGISYGPEGNFRKLSENRRALAERLRPQRTATTVEIERKLNEPITLPNSDQMSLGEAIKYLGEYTGLNIVPDINALNEEGLTLNTPVNVTAVKNVPLKTVLKYMLRPLHLSYATVDDVLLITSPTANKSRMDTIVYDVADLVISPHSKKNGINSGLPYVPPPGMAAPSDPNLLQAQASAMVNGMQGQVGTAITPSGSNGSSGSNGERDIDFGPLIQLMKTSIAPGSWSNDHTPVDGGMAPAYGQGAGGGAGGGADEEGVGSITPFFLNISLIIRQTAEVHEQIVDLLRQLRRLQDLQVSIEVRFITVSDDFFEQVGVDFDMNIQSDAIGRKSSFAVPNAGAGNLFPGQTTGGGGTANTATVPYLINPIRDHALGRQPLVVGTNASTTDLTTPAFTPNLGIPFTQSTLDAIAPFNLVPNVAANFGIAFLSDLEVFFFMTAIQGDQRSNVVLAPKVTSLNGAAASVINFRGENYVAGLFPIIGVGSVAFQPQIQTFPSGVQLFVTPVVSADRRYVRMSLNPVFTTLEGFDNFTVPAAVGGGGLGGQSGTVNAQLQLPIFTIASISTTVTVPDGGTVLLGGVKELREERNEFGVPILGKTPMIDRLFRNIGIGRRTRSLMLMVTPRIIILEEEEEKLGVPAINNFTF